MPSGFSVRLPLAGPLTSVAVNVLPSASASFDNTSPVRTVSSSVLNVSLTATGVSLTALTVIDTVATELVAVPSLAVYVKESAPL
ncbi:hypothetical protein MYFR107205_15695 [Mycolicibacterium frederiksbergense]